MSLPLYTSCVQGYALSCSFLGKTLASYDADTLKVNIYPELSKKKKKDKHLPGFMVTLLY